ncbi:MAG: alpha/beta family hydrolase [Candidatus Limnocylindrales bacterium]
MNPADIRIVLGHGASGTASSMAPYVAGLRARGFDAYAIDLRRGRAEDAVAGFWTATEALPAQNQGSSPGRPNRLVLAGQSFGGRVASLVAAERPAEVAAVICFSYPLHRPGAPETWQERTAHWPRIACPVLLLSGESDPFAKIELLRSAIDGLAAVELVTYPRLGHGLRPVLPEVLDRVAAFVGALGCDGSGARRAP